MNDTIIKILDCIEYDPSHYDDFNMVKNARLVFQKSDETLHIYIDSKTVLPVNTYFSINECLRKKFNKGKIHINVIDKTSITEPLINVYYCGFLNNFYSNYPISDVGRNLKLKLEDNNIICDIESKLLFEGIKDLKLERAFKSAGIDYKIIYNYHPLDQEEVQKKLDEDYNRIMQDALEHIENDEPSKPIDDVIARPTPNKTFYKEKAQELLLKDISNNDMNVIITCRIFDVEVNTTRNGTNIYSIYLTDNTDSVMMKLRKSSKFPEEFLLTLKPGTWIRTRGDMYYDSWSRDYLFQPKTIDVIEHKEVIKDVEGKKRVELHVHTKLSMMDGIGSIEEYVARAREFGMTAMALTDHANIQAFPAFQRITDKCKDIKPLYGMEGYVVNDNLNPVYNKKHIPIEGQTYVCFDLETTGLSQEYDKIIEFGAVKIKNGFTVDTYQTFINPKQKLSAFTKNLTNISDDDVMNAPTIEEIMPSILKFFGDDIIVAHNAKFDYGFINKNLKNMGMDTLHNPVIDTLDLSKMILDQGSYALGAVCRKLNIDYDEEVAHRADYDATVLGNALVSILGLITNDYDIHYIDEIENIPVNEVHKKMRPFHATILVKNMKGLRNLYEIVTKSHIEFVKDVPLIPRRILNQYHEGLIFGTSCYNSEIFDMVQTSDLDSVVEAMKFYDYIEIQPPCLYEHLVEHHKVDSMDTIYRIINDILKCANKANKMVVASGDVHFVKEEDRIFHDVYIYAKAKGARRHPLHSHKYPLKESPAYYFRTTKDMLEQFKFLGEEKAYEIVVDNTNYIADSIEHIIPLGTELCTPIIPGLDAQEYMEDLCYKTAKEKYGDPLPEIIQARLDKELGKIKDNKFAIIYYLAHKLVVHSNEDGYLVGSRGSVGSSVVATFSQITEVNGLPPHYICPHCKHIEWLDPTKVKSGYDVVDKPCPECGTLMKGDGHDIPFETFLGINGDKVPDIDLNFSRDYQASAHNYTKVLLGEHNVFKAGTIGTVAEKTANGYAVNFFEETGKEDYREAEIHRLGKYCEGVKRTTGQHPGGIVVIPDYKGVHDFTPIQYPADEDDSSWMTTHYTYHDIDTEVLKLDILGHLDPYALRMLQDLTGVNLKEIPMNDQKVLSLFTSCEALGVTNEQILDENGSLGIPEFGTTVAKGILKDAKPKKFSELVQVSGLSHGTDVWKGNAQELINNGTATLEETIGCRDDIMTRLIQYGLEAKPAFDIMEFVRKGKLYKGGAEKWEGYKKTLKEHNVPDWYIDSLALIKYMFPKAHACAYVMMALRIAWFKIYYPLEYYASYFSIRCDFFDIETMVKGYDAIKERFVKLKQALKERDPSLSSKEKNGLDDVLHIALEMTARGYKILPISLEKSDATKWVVDHERNGIIPAFNSLDGLGDAAAESIVKARNERPFISKKDLMERASVSKTLVSVMEHLGVLDGLSDENQLSFDLF